MVGGSIIEVMEVVFEGRDGPRSVTRLWVIDRNAERCDECCVYVVPHPHRSKRTPVTVPIRMPRLGEQVWWQSGQVLFDGDRLYLPKIGYSFAPSAETRRDESSKPRRELT